MQHNLCCANLISGSWRTWKLNQRTPTHLIRTLDVSDRSTSPKLCALAHTRLHFETWNVPKHPTFSVCEWCIYHSRRAFWNVRRLSKHNKMKDQGNFLLTNFSLRLVTTLLVSHPRVWVVTFYPNVGSFGTFDVSKVICIRTREVILW